MILITGAKAVLPGAVQALDILIDEKTGKIVRMGKGLPHKGAKLVHAHGLLALPGAIDPHVHMRDPEDTSKEDFSTGSASALCGGVTTFIDMPCYRNPATNTVAAYAAKRRIAGRKCRCDWQLRFGASEKNQKEAAKSGAPSLKVFLCSTGSELYCSLAAAAKHFRAFPKEKPICVHAEDNARIEERKLRCSENEKARDKLVAQLGCQSALRMANRARRRVHVCHLTTAKEVDMCRHCKYATYEINPAHLYLSTDDLCELGFLGKINPPLRDRTEAKKLWRKIGNDTIIASDHAPHLPRQKKDGAPGFPGVGTMLPLMLHAVHLRKFPVERLARICSLNAANAFGLHSKGKLAEGHDADIVLVDMHKKWRISAKNRHSRAGWTPFEGKEVYGKIMGVYLRGRLAFDGERVLAKPGCGKEAVHPGRGRGWARLAKPGYGKEVK
jgi:dihydroorotase